jgi:hypothetical protein
LQDLGGHEKRKTRFKTDIIILFDGAIHKVSTPTVKWFWLLIGIFAFDVWISLGDFMIERASREFFGRLPTGEYIFTLCKRSTRGVG